MSCSGGISHFLVLLGIVIGWSILWKALALWYSARNYDKMWFMIFILLNLLGIPEILYLYFRTDFFERIEN